MILVLCQKSAKVTAELKRSRQDLIRRKNYAVNHASHTYRSQLDRFGAVKIFIFKPKLPFLRENHQNDN